MLDLESMGQAARAAGRKLSLIATEDKNAALEAIADALLAPEHIAEVLAANVADLERGQAAGLPAAFLDRMLLNPARIAAMAGDVRNVAQLPDPVGETFDHATLPNGLRLHKLRVPFGVVGVIYESRPNVTVDVATLCLKSGNATILRSGTAITASCAALVTIIRRTLATLGLPEATVQAIDDPDRAVVERMLKLDRYIDVIIPRGGEQLQQFCRQHATMPVMTGGVGVCHIYVDQDADLAKVVPLVRNAKIQRPSACNALDTLLIDRRIAAEILPAIARDLLEHQVELRADEESLSLLRACGVQASQVTPARETDFGVEFLDMIASVRIVDGLDDALEHIARFGGHSDAILSDNPATAAQFVRAVDSAVVFVNASTRFNDGAQFGLGAEVAISTQKLHARGPMALRELTTYKWVAEGDGHVRA